MRDIAGNPSPELYTDSGSPNIIDRSAGFILGTNDDIYYLVRMNNNGFESDLVGTLGCYGCGRRGLNSDIGWIGGTAVISFTTGGDPCKLEVNYLGDKWRAGRTYGNYDNLCN